MLLVIPFTECYPIYFQNVDPRLQNICLRFHLKGVNRYIICERKPKLQVSEHRRLRDMFGHK